MMTVEVVGSPVGTTSAPLDKSASTHLSTTSPASTHLSLSTTPSRPTTSPPSSHPSAPPPQPPGTGHVHLASGSRAHFTSLHASYPLKLLAPRPLPSQPSDVALLYTLAYGGGLVSGDCVQLSCSVEAGQTLVLRTQGSTKVYKHRSGLRPASHAISPALSAAVNRGEQAPAVRQRMHVRLEQGATFILLPDALSPFRGSRYVQAQRVIVPSDDSASVLLLDWLNSGRGDRPVGRPELRPWSERSPHGNARGGKSQWTDAAAADTDTDTDADASPTTTTTPSPSAASPSQDKSDWGKASEEYWAMAYYASTNELLVGPTTVARERMVLDNANDLSPSALSPIARKLAPYHVYATVLVYGPKFVALRKHLDALADATSQFQVPKPPGLLWSYSGLAGDCGIIRVAGLEVEDVRDWLRGALEEGGVAELVGPGLWPRCI